MQYALKQEAMEDKQYHHDDEVTLKDIVHVIRDYWEELWKYWYLVPLFCIPTVSWYMYKHFTHEVEYTAKIKFVVEEGGSSGGVIGGLLGQFGIGGKESGFGPLKISEVLKSNVNIAEVLLDTAGNKTMLANDLLTAYQIPAKWAEKKPEWKDFKVENYTVATLDSMELMALGSLYSRVVGSESNPDPWMTFGFNEESGVMSITATANSEALAKRLANTVLKTTKNFFEVKLVTDKLSTRQFLEQKRDSLQAVITSNEYAIAKFNTGNRGLIDQTSLVPLADLQRNITIAGLALGEVVKNFEVADYTLKSSKPFFFVIDRPLGPLPPVQSSIIVRFIIGCILGGALYFTFIVGRKLLRDALNEEA